MLQAAPSTMCRLTSSGRVWLCDDDLGLTRAPSYALLQDRRGYLWIGSERGPQLFDGLVWTTPAGLTALGNWIVRSFAETPGQALWIGTDTAGLVCVDLATTPYRVVSRFTEAQGLPGNTVYAVCIDPQGQVWAATNGGVAVLRDGRVCRRFTAEDGLPSARAWTMCSDPHGRIWVGTKEGLAVIVDETVSALQDQEPEAATYGVHAVCCDAHGCIWAGLVGGDLRRVIETGAGGWALRQVHATGARVRALCPDHRGRLWVGTSAGVLVFEGERLHDTWTTADGLPVQGVWALWCDRNERVWASTSTGLVLIAQAAPLVRTLPAAVDTPQGLVFACEPDGHGRVWIASESGIMAADAAGHEVVPPPALPAAVAREMVWALRLDRRGHMWVGTDRAGLLCVDPVSGAQLAHITLGVRTPALCLEGEHHLWASFAGLGLVCVDIDTYHVAHRLGAGEGLPHDVVNALQADGQGHLWAGTSSGRLACLDPRFGTVQAILTLGDHHNHGDHHDHTEYPISDIARSDAGFLWVATYGGGLVCIDPRRRMVVRSLTTREDAPSDLMYACLVDPQGHVWVGTHRGVARYTPETGCWAVVGRGLGLPSEECNARALALDRGARLWVGTVGGVGIVDTERIAAHVPPCAVNLTGLSVMGQDRGVTSDLEIEDSDYDLAFTYGAVSFVAPHQVVYRVQLAGLESGWSAPTVQRSVRYTNLRPGVYTFRVAARNWGGCWSEPEELSFRVIRNRQAQALDEALERERIAKEVALATAARLEELNRQLEETDRLKTQLISQIRDQAALFERLSQQDGLTGLLNRRALDDRLADEFARARRYGHALTVVLADIDHFKHINDTYSHLVGDQVLKTVAHLCRITARGEDSIGRYGGEEIALILPETVAAEGVTLCERLRRSIEDYDWESIAAGLRVTISVGVSDWREAPHHEKMLADADAYLYQAKQEGRNRTCSAGDLGDLHHGNIDRITA